MAKKEDNLRKGNPEHAFTSENQPSNEAKSNGIKKKYLLKDICNQIVGGTAADSLKALSELLGIPVNQIDIETLMHLKQIEIAINTGDTKAYSAVLDRLKGKPMQAIDHSTLGKEVKGTVINLGSGVNQDEATE